MCHCPNTQTRWFKVPFSSPSWRSLNLSKRSLNHPQKVTLNHQGHMFWPICVLKGESWSDWLVVLVVAGAWKVSKFMYQTNQTPHGFSQKICVCFFALVALRNYINHGSKNGDVGAARGFAIETLPAITSFKLGKLGWSCWEPGGYLLGISVSWMLLKLVG